MPDCTDEGATKKSKFYIKHSGVYAGALSRVLEKRDSGKTSVLRLTETVVFSFLTKNIDSAFADTSFCSVMYFVFKIDMLGKQNYFCL